MPMLFKTRGKSAAMGLAVTLAAGMCPAFASAAELTASADVAKSTPELQTQASKTMYVLTGITQVEKGKTKLEDEVCNYTEKQTVKFTYGSKGLLSKNSYARKYTNGKFAASDKSTRKWTYDKKNRIATLSKSIGKLKYTYDSKGRLKKAVLKANYPVKFTFSYKSGRIAEIKTKAGTGTGTSGKYALSYKNGRVANIKNYDGAASSPFNTDFAFDSKGNIKSVGSKEIAATYNGKGLLAKRVISHKNEKTGLGGVKTITYKYKAIKVSSGLASKVKAQQWALLNENLNLAIDAQIGEGFFNCGNMFQ